MCCHVRGASVSRRRSQQLRQFARLPPMAVLDLSKPAEREAHAFLCRAMSNHDRMWKLLDLRRQGDLLLCVVRWVHSADATKPFALAEVSLTETAVCWRHHATAEAAQAAMERRCAASSVQEGNARS